MLLDNKFTFSPEIAGKREIFFFIYAGVGVSAEKMFVFSAE
jgi:hypothetical protein